MAQNRSSAVMANRVEPPDSLDFFPTPPWAARALAEHVLIGGGWRRDDLARMSCWEPACGEGHLARGLVDVFGGPVWLSDVHDYGVPGAHLHDFLFPTPPAWIGRERIDWIVTNPPFVVGNQFVMRALDLAKVGVAMFVRIAFLEGQDRYRDLYATSRRPSLIGHFAERVVLNKGRLLDPNKSYPHPETGKLRRPSSATAYCWLVWSKQPWHAGIHFSATRWIPPCRRALERPEDYR